MCVIFIIFLRSRGLCRNKWFFDCIYIQKIIANSLKPQQIAYVPFIYVDCQRVRLKSSINFLILMYVEGSPNGLSRSFIPNANTPSTKLVSVESIRISTHLNSYRREREREIPSAVWVFCYHFYGKNNLFVANLYVLMA